MSSHVERELLAYLDGELEAREQARVEAHLEKCARCAAELERLQALQGELDATFDAALAPVRLPRAADSRIRELLRARTEARARPWRALWQRRGLVAQALLATLVLFLAFNTSHMLQLPAPHETLVLGQNRLAPASKAALRVIVRSTEGAQPIEGAQVAVKVGRTPGLAQLVYTGRTDASGAAEVSFDLPQGLEGEASLVVETSSAGGQGQIVRPITIARDHKLFLSSDKPAYRPGQTIHLRALALAAADLEPAAGQEIAFALLGPAGERLERGAATASDFGVAALDFPIPSGAAHGQYTLRAALGETVSERTVAVEAYELPDFHVTLETDRPFYAPGERVTGRVRAEYFFGKPVASGEAILYGYAGERGPTPAILFQGRTNEEGVLEFAFQLPPSFGQSATEQPIFFDLEGSVTDAAMQREGIRRLLPVSAQSILISAIPESGALKPGVENAIFILSSYPDGRPAETTLEVEIDGEQYTLAAGPYGLAELRYVPLGLSSRLEVRAQDARGAEGRAAFTFESDRAPQTLLLRAERAAYEVGDTLRLEALVAEADETASQTVYLDAVHAGQTVAAYSSPVEDGRAVFALDLDGTMVGTLELHAYLLLPDDDIVQDTRLVIVDAPRQVAVAVTADREEYRPGETAHLRLQTTLTSTDGAEPQAVQSALGIGVVDESVYALEELPPSFARAYFLLEQELRKQRGQGLDVPTLLDARAELKEAQDTAARAAWAGARGTDFTLSAESTAEQREDAAARLAHAANWIGLALSLLPLLLGVVVLRGAWLTGVLWHALRRVVIGLLLLCVSSPLTIGATWLLWAALGVGAPALLVLIVIALLAGLTIHGWRRGEAQMQTATGLLAAYLALGGLLVALAAGGGDLPGALLALIAVTFPLLVAALAILGQGLVLEGWRRAGWAATALALLSIPLVIYLPFIPGLASDLTRQLGHPAIYAGPVGWLTGCTAAPATPEQVVVTTIVEKEGETIIEEVVVTATPAAAATAEPEEEATEEPTEPTTTPATPAPIPAEPFPLRQVFPETLYWSAESLTDEAGNLTLDLPLADQITTWRLTALASTQEGELGFAAYDVVVFQDFFVELDLPDAIAQGEEISASVTLYNYLEQAQTVQLELVPDDWYEVVSTPEPVTLPGNDVATVPFTIRAEQSGDFALQVVAAGERMSDAVAVDVSVEE